jgi:hypothetical protein
MSLKLKSMRSPTKAKDKAEVKVQKCRLSMLFCRALLSYLCHEHTILFMMCLLSGGEELSILMLKWKGSRSEKLRVEGFVLPKS